MRLLFLNGLFFFFPVWMQSSITGREQYFFQIIEYVAPNFLFSTDPEEIKYQEKLLLSCNLVCKGWKETLDERFDFKKMENLFVITNHRPRKEFLSCYKKRMRILKKHDYDYDSDHDDSWLPDQNNQMTTYKVNDIFNDSSLTQYLDFPFLFSCYFQKKMKNELNEFSNKGCQKSLLYIKAGGFLSQSLFECMFQYMYPAADKVTVDLCTDCKYQRCELFFTILSHYNRNIFLQKKLSFMLKRKRYVTDNAIIGSACRIEISDETLDYQLFLSNFINERKKNQEAKTESFFDIAVIEGFFAEYKEIFAKNDYTGKSFLYYLLSLLFDGQRVNCLTELFTAFLKQMTKVNSQSFADYGDLEEQKTQCRKRFEKLLH